MQAVITICMGLYNCMNKKAHLPLIPSHSAAMQECMRTAEMIACTDVNVLLLGEPGVGKYRIARHIHQKSSRSQKSFITLNCATLAEAQAESALFGSYQKSHTDKTVYKGALVKASSGTLLLENIEKLPLKVQEKLLEFIKQGEICLPGQAIPCRFNVRLIAASSENLEQQAKQGRFHQELFYYLNIVPLQVPALRQRKEDIADLMQALFIDLVKEYRLASPSFDDKVCQALSRYDWHGNLLELHNFCERMLILFAGKTVELGNLPMEIQQAYLSSNKSDCIFQLPESGINLEAVEQDLMQQAILKSQGNKSKAARLLGLSRDTFLYRLKKYGVI